MEGFCPKTTNNYEIQSARFTVMAGTLAVPQNPPDKGRKRLIPHTPENERLEKRLKSLLQDDTSDKDSESSVAGGVPLERSTSPPNENGFTINQDFARRFEHNKKREELQNRLWN